MQAYRDARVQAVQMIGAANHEDAVVGLEAVDLVQEVAPDVVRDDGVEVLEDEVARGTLSRLLEDLPNGSLGAGVLFIYGTR